MLNPRVLLLDEPLGALDARLRKDLQVELKSLQQDLGITFVYVTHDQEEALTMSDRLAVMNNGQVEQMGGPQEVYEAPDTRFVAEFLGVSNMLSGNATGNGTFRIGDFTLRCGQGATSATGVVHAVIRPERVVVGDHGVTGDNTLPGLIDRVVFVGSVLDVRVRLATGELLRSLVDERRRRRASRPSRARPSACTCRPRRSGSCTRRATSSAGLRPAGSRAEPERRQSWRLCPKSNAASTDSPGVPFASWAVSLSRSVRKLRENESIGSSDAPLVWYELTRMSVTVSL